MGTGYPILPVQLLRTLKHSFTHIRLLLARPRIIPRTLAGYSKAILLKRNVLRVVEFVINWECQSKCVMCFASKNKKEGDMPLSVQEIRAVWRQARRLGAIAAVLEGGEATLRSDLPDIVKALEPWDAITNLITNALALDKRRLLELKDAGLSSVCFSLDGPDAKTNDEIRGYKGHFDHVMKCIDWSKEMGLDVYVGPTFSHGQIDRLKKIVQLAKDKGVKVGASTAVVSGKWAAAHQHMLADEEWKEIKQLMAWYPFIRFDWSINFSMRTECPGGREKICIGIYGDVSGCATNPISFGNVRKEPLETIWKRMQKFYYFKKRSPKCLVSEDREYIQNYIDPISDYREHPVSIDEHPLNKPLVTIR